MANNALFEPAFGAQVGGPDNRLLAAPPTAADAYQFDADAAARSLRGAWAAAQDPQTWQDAAQQWGNAMIAGTSAPGFRAFHGSPHAFERFDASKIGTGEGAQAYGHGLYLADEEGVARTYRDKLAGPGDPRLYVGGKPLDPASVEGRVANLANTGGFPAAEKAIKFWIDKGEYGPEYQAALDALRGKEITTLPPPGHMYEVQVNADPAHFLDWDKPLAEQSPHVRDALQHPAISDFLKQRGYESGAASMGPNRSAGSLYDQLGVTSNGMDAGAASQRLKAAGIPGIRYLDGGSRANGEGTSNHVIFDPATIEILRKYGIAGLMAGGAAAASGQSEQ